MRCYSNWAISNFELFVDSGRLGSPAFDLRSTSREGGGKDGRLLATATAGINQVIGEVCACSSYGCGQRCLGRSDKSLLIKYWLFA
jgi:hypothetical protein